MTATGRLRNEPNWTRIALFPNVKDLGGEPLDFGRPVLLVLAGQFRGG